MTKENAVKELKQEVDGMSAHGGYDVQDVFDIAKRLIMEIDEI